mmetsp:Transcript_123461/g.345696  ORF Transcript_123461/g.345696 Transcript_123461/m.345696 type:complete len:1037 (+) Transcript_123461:76-3186(+)
MAVKIVPAHTVPGHKWPTRLELTTLMEEQTIEDLDALTQMGGARRLCEMLGADMEAGLPHPVSDFDERRAEFGENKFEERKLTPYWKYALRQCKEKIIVLLLFMATLELVVKSIWGKDQDERTEAIAESCVLYMTVCIIVNVAALLDWKRERMFEALTKRLAASNKRFIIRDGKQMEVTDQDICVGDIVSFNAHMAAIISCDGIFLSGKDVKTDESALTGEPEPIAKNEEHPFMISGTTVNAGGGTMLVIAVGDYSIAGKIKKSVYGQGETEPSPLYSKLHAMANTIGAVGIACASVAFIAMCIWSFGVHKKDAAELLDIFLVTLGVLACAIPEGLPLALVIALALTSNKMTKENNLVKTLNSCETMGSATTICTDKTGTLTTNRMTVRGANITGLDIEVTTGGSVGQALKDDSRIQADLKELLAHLCGCCTMNESGIRYEPGSSVPTFQGNPTECALLKMAQEMGFDYEAIRNEVVGRSPTTLDQGSAKVFTSSRKMMSWTVRRPGGGYRVYAKGASEIVLGRCTRLHQAGDIRDLSEIEAKHIMDTTISKFANNAMRTIGVAYRDIDMLRPDALDAATLNSDGSPAYACETGLTLLGVLGIEDPLRPEVAPAIAKCYKAGIDVRMVTGDNLQTAIAIAKGAGILNMELHCDKAGQVLPKRAMEGKDFRKYVHDISNGEAVFNQAKFDQIWPYLRVLARSSPDDKLTLAKGLNGSQVYKDKARCAELLRDDQIVVFPDRQVVAMTGDGTNDAPALKSADVGFAMGIAGTQIAKDAANIILLDDNFASIVVAAKWGRNVFDSIQKFLQFQLTVNASILIINVICAVADKKSPLTVLHLLWLNLIMDSAASIALASEPPTDQLLERPPVNRNDSIVTGRMLVNIVGMACYEISLMCGLLWSYEWIPDLEFHGLEVATGKKSKHYTMLFNTFVLLQVANEYNSRFLRGEWQIWRGLSKNPLYLVISLGTMLVQVILVQIASPIMSYPLKIHPEGLSAAQWFICIGFAAGTLVVQQFLNLAYLAVSFALGIPSEGQRPK